MNKLTKRAFLAAELPEETQGHLGRIQNRLKAMLEGVRWVQPTNIHLTIKFLGDIDPAAIEAISEIVRRHAAARNAMGFSPAGLGGFPDASHPRVIWVGLEGDGASLAKLHGFIESDLEPLGYSKDKRKFTPHLTLGRTKSPRGVVPGLRGLLQREITTGIPSFTVYGLTLFESDLQPRGVVYRRLEQYPFKT